MFIILGYIGTVIILISAVIFSRSYMRNHRKEFVEGAPSHVKTNSFIVNHPGLCVLILTPLLFGAAWFVGWSLSR